jgi:LmbE family N-acetylglucosaminyl deacetylase
MKSRRQFVKKTTAGLGLFSLSSLLHTQTKENIEKKKIVCVGAHPDDPESGCGGTLAKLNKQGHAISIIYLTTGEAGIAGKGHDEASTIRKQEAMNACAVLNAKPVFAGQIDGDTVINNTWLSKIQQLIYDEKPDVVFTHWPLDSHKDHQVASLLTIQSWVRAQQIFTLYFFEVCAGEQTMTFHPTDYIDVTDTQELKRKSVFCHASQNPAGIYDCGHAAMEEFRGRELGVKAAEAFICMNGRKQSSFSTIYF